MNLPVLNQRPECTQCDLHKTGCKSVGMAMQWLPTSLPPSPTTPVVVCVASFPSYHDDAANVPLTGPSGQVCRAAYLAPLSQKATIYITDALRCNPKGLTDFKPNAKMLNACSYTLRQDLGLIYATQKASTLRYILILGSVASNAVLGCTLKGALAQNATPAIFHHYTVLTTHHPAAIVHQPPLIHSVADHIQLLVDHLNSEAPVPTKPNFVPPRMPQTLDPKLISLDIETYGSIKKGPRKELLPKQTVFHPERSITTDLGNSFNNLIVSIAITLPARNPAIDQRMHSFDDHACLIDDLAKSVPGETFILYPHIKPHRDIIIAWLKHSITILCMNTQFDMLYMMAKDYAEYLQHQLLLDLGIFNYLHNEVRIERSLKTLGPVLGTHVYKSQTLKGGFRFPSLCPAHSTYNGQDTHNTLAATIRLVQLIIGQFGSSTDKLSVYNIRFFSNTLRTCIDMSINGVAMNRTILEDMEDELMDEMDHAIHDAKAFHDLTLAGKGSQLSRSDFLHTCITSITHPEEYANVHESGT